MNLRQAVFVSALLIVFALSMAMVLPFFGYVIAAGILAYMLYPAQERLTERMRPSIAAAVMTALTILAVIIPLMIAGGLVAEDAQQIIQQVQQEDTGVLEQIEERIAVITGRNVQLQQEGNAADTVSPGTAETISQFLGEAVHTGIGISLLVILQFYILRDGKQLVEWSKTFEIIPTDMQDDLYREAGDMVTAVVKGHVFMAVIQGVAIGPGLWIAGIPNPVFWTFIAVIFGLIPFIGVLGVWIPASLYLLFTGNFLAGALLFLYGALISSVFEDVVRPLIVKRDMPIHEAYILVGVIGGIFVYGPIGVFIGPVLFGMLHILTDMFKERYGDLGQPYP